MEGKRGEGEGHSVGEGGGSGQGDCAQRRNGGWVAEGGGRAGSGAQGSQYTAGLAG